MAPCMAQPQKLASDGTDGDFPESRRHGLAGNSERVAEKHYLQVFDSHFAKAVEPSPKTARNPTRTVPETTRSNAHEEPKNAKTPCFQGVRDSSLGDEGLEPPTLSV